MAKAEVREKEEKEEKVEEEEEDKEEEEEKQKTLPIATMNLEKSQFHQFRGEGGSTKTAKYVTLTFGLIALICWIYAEISLISVYLSVATDNRAT